MSILKNIIGCYQDRNSDFIKLNDYNSQPTNPRGHTSISLTSFNCTKNRMTLNSNPKLHYRYFSGKAQKEKGVLNFHAFENKLRKTVPFSSKVTGMQFRIFDFKKNTIR